MTKNTSFVGQGDISFVYISHLLSTKGGTTSLSREKIYKYIYVYISHTSTFQLLNKPWSQVSSPLPPGSCLYFFIAHRVQQSQCSSIFHRATHALALSASQFVHKKNSQRIYTSMHSAGLELTKLTYSRLEDNLIHQVTAVGSAMCREFDSHPLHICLFQACALTTL